MNISFANEPERPHHTPLKTWMRSLTPSRIFGVDVDGVADTNFGVFLFLVGLLTISMMALLLMTIVLGFRRWWFEGRAR